MKDTKNLSLGSYSVTNPNLSIETWAIQNGNSTTSNHISAGVFIYATDGFVKGKVSIASTSTCTGSITAPTVIFA